MIAMSRRGSLNNTIITGFGLPSKAGKVVVAEVEKLGDG